MNTTEANTAKDAKTLVTADYVGLTFTGIIVSVDVTGRDVLIKDADGNVQWIPTHLVIAAETEKETDENAQYEVYMIERNDSGDANGWYLDPDFRSMTDRKEAANLLRTLRKIRNKKVTMTVVTVFVTPDGYITDDGRVTRN